MNTISNQINRFISEIGGITKFFIQANFNDLLNYAKITENPKHLDFLADCRNYAVLLVLAENPMTSSETLDKMAREHINVAPLMLSISRHPNCSKKTGVDISWEELETKVKDRNKKVVMYPDSIQTTYLSISWQRLRTKHR
jgi:hypothetical protein